MLHFSSKNQIKYSKTIQKDQNLVFKTDYHLMQVKSIAECSKGSILQYFRPSLSYHSSLRSGFLSIFEWPLKTCFTVTKKHAQIQEFSPGGPGQTDKKKSSDVFCFSVLSLFYRSQMVNFKEIYHFSRFQRRSNILQGGGVQLLCPIETNITCDFPGGVRTPCPPPPLDPHLKNQYLLRQVVH